MNSEEFAESSCLWGNRRESEGNSAFHIRFSANPIFRQADYSACYSLHAGFSLALFLHLEDGGDISFRNIGRFSADYTPLHPIQENERI
jgi:hypothetical protein